MKGRLKVSGLMRWSREPVAYLQLEKWQPIETTGDDDEKMVTCCRHTGVASYGALEHVPPPTILFLVHFGVNMRAILCIV